MWEADPSGVLAVVDKPGSGKSVLAKTIHRKLSTFPAITSNSDSLQGLASKRRT